MRKFFLQIALALLLGFSVTPDTWPFLQGACVALFIYLLPVYIRLEQRAES